MGEDTGEAAIDVAIVGYGPVGQALAAWLGAAGHRVACFERFGELYQLPRAVHLDHEVMRLLQRLGVAERLAPEMLSFGEYHWFGADGETIMVLRPETPTLSAGSRTASISASICPIMSAASARWWRRSIFPTAFGSTTVT